jgi:transposase
VSKEKISVAIADSGRDAPRFWGTITHTAEAVRKLMKQLGETGPHQVCYEAGPTGFDLYHWLIKMGISCTVIAPSLIPKRQGDPIKTDRRDALRLAQLFRAGELTPIHVPSREQEALRDLVRAREDARDDLHRARQRMVHFLLRHHIHPPAVMKRRWTKMYRKWLETLKFTYTCEQLVHQEYLQHLFECEQRLARIDQSMAEESSKGAHANVIRALQALRGIALVHAVSIATEIGSFERFRSPMQLMAYLGLVPREFSSGLSSRKGKMTKAGNSLLRRIFVEAAWSYRHSPAIKGDLKKRLDGQAAMIQAISWKAQTRLNKKFFRLVINRGKHKNVAIGATARELVGFVWAVARQAEGSHLA